MDVHPSRIPVAKVFDVRDERQAAEAAEEMVRLGFSNRRNGFRVLMPKEKKVAKGIGYTVTSTLNYMLRKDNRRRDLRYWTYHHDDDHYAIVLISNSVLERLGL